MRLLDTEFSLNPHGEVLIHDRQGIRTYREEDREVTDALIDFIETDYREAFEALQSIYIKSRANTLFFRYRIVRRFLCCNFGRLDDQQDIDERGYAHFEYVDCPLRGECPHRDIICNPKFSTALSLREVEVMKMLCEGRSTMEVADMLYLSEETVKTHRRNAYRRAGVNTLAEFMLYASTHNLFNNRS